MMVYTAVKNPVFADAQQKLINCLVKFEQFPDFVPFTASLTDTEEHSQQIYTECLLEKYGVVGAYVYDPTADIAEAADEKQLRLSRATAVTELWRTQLALGIINDVDREQLTAWMIYAQKLQAMNVTENYADIHWPLEPDNLL